MNTIFVSKYWRYVIFLSLAVLFLGYTAPTEASQFTGKKLESACLYGTFGTGTFTVNVTSGLSSNTTYYFKVFEYNCSVGSEKYNVTSPPSGSQSTSSASLPNAGKDQYLCSGTTVVTMAATGTGTWSQISGAAATITTPSSITSTITGLASGTYVFRWTSGCGYDEMIVVVQ